MTDSYENAHAWLAEDPDPETKAELTRLLAAAEQGHAGARADLEDRFSGTLQFGTAGLRGALGAGPNRMNRVVVIRAAAGLGAYLHRQGHEGGRVVIGYDARHNSNVFATDTAEILAGAGFRPLLLPQALPTPVLAYAIRKLECVAGVMVTASHNPPQDNGYKVYLGNGSQIVPPADTDIAGEISAVGSIARLPRSDAWRILDSKVVDDYVERAAALVDAGAEAVPRELSMVYTPLHGVGGSVVRQVLQRAGFASPAMVEAQAEPDPDFPTVAFPNPEEPGALDLSYDLATRLGADIILANDPDADRCAVAVPTPDHGWRRLTGDEVGALLAVHLLRSGAHGTFATTIVSSTLLSAIAAKWQQPYAETLTGFKWLGRIPGLAYGYEEALGYCVDPSAVGDKDGISALLRIVELAASLRSEGRTLLDMLDDIAREFGVYATEQISIRVTDVGSIAGLVDRLLQAPPETLGGRSVEQVDDLAQSADDLPPTTGVRFRLSEGARVVVRPSGTEPKLKCYLEVVVPPPAAKDLDAARTRARADLGALRPDLERLLATD